MLEKVEGIVLRTRDYGESNKVVILFTREQGKLAAMARGAKKPKSRLGGATQPFTMGQYLCFIGSGMATVSQADILESHHPLRFDLILASYASYLTEFLDRMTVEKEPAPALYELLLSTFEMMEDGVDPDILARIFELKVLETAGYRPVLDGCMVCGATDRPVKFSVRQGGFLCLHCADRDPRALSLSPAAARIIKTLQRVTPDRLGNVQVKEETKQQLERALRSFVDEYVDVRLKSRDFLDRVRRDWSEES
ncbi:MAG: DNA repair protein RecO [Firmicutes bacterium]|mgnify:CR=1 FL=1|uniref:DNA repair protein RecO n=1 Tax=Melghirimyces thermohalophilus TaxID=1236220 RepID=A0A1G6P3R3_9BACL|nr:DNA repair protein RecO [Melghirimyces thermohalophilus]MDA8352241.1 DNA repair protein RecO [Bacillota bacterium]SDC74648.1 DNA replication and repair protein RecO [Melghirimyces thermohalophilus]